MDQFRRFNIQPIGVPGRKKKIREWVKYIRK